MIEKQRRRYIPDQLCRRNRAEREKKGSAPPPDHGTAVGISDIRSRASRGLFAIGYVAEAIS